MNVRRVSKEELKTYSKSGYGNTVFTTYEWISFIEQNQKAEPVVLELFDREKKVGLFVGLVVKKMGVRILGSPFEGWLTPDMGFIYIDRFDVNEALQCVARYAFKTLKCLYVQICDKRIKIEDLKSNIKYQTRTLLKLSISSDVENIVSGFIRNGRRDVRASMRKGLEAKKVPFDNDFVDMYYSQLIDVFDKQNLKPFYNKQKLYDLVDAFKDSPEKVFAVAIFSEDNKCVATIMSLGFNQWGYYLGAASYRDYQRYLPNERAFLCFVEHWSTLCINDLDLVGYREYKMKYNPELIDVPVIYFEKIPGLLKIKGIMRKAISFVRVLRGKK